MIELVTPLTSGGAIRSSLAHHFVVQLLPTCKSEYLEGRADQNHPNERSSHLHQSVKSSTGISRRVWSEWELPFLSWPISDAEICFTSGCASLTR